MADFDNYIGLPWKEKGRDPTGFDCWGLLRFIYLEEYGLELPSFSDSYKTVEDGKALSDLIAGEMGPWQPVAKGTERVSDAVLMTLQGQPRHVGLIVAPSLVLHIERATGSLIENYESFRLQRRVIGFFRHRYFNDREDR